MKHLLHKLETPNPDCYHCQGQGFMNLYPEISCPQCWVYRLQANKDAPTRPEMAVALTVLYEILAERNGCPECDGAGSIEDQPCQCVLKTEATLRAFAKLAATATAETLWLTGIEGIDDLIEEVIHV